MKFAKLSVCKYTHFLLFWLLSTLWIYYSHRYSMTILPLYLSFHFHSLHRHPDPTFFCISAQIPRIPTLVSRTHIPIPFLAFPLLFFTFSSFHFPILILAYTDSLPTLKSFRIFLRKIVALIQKQTLPFVTNA